MPAKLTTKAEVKNLILTFWHLNASRAPIADFLPIIDSENIEIILKGTNVKFTGIAELADHQIGKLIFFDQQFKLKNIKTTITADKAVAKTEGQWYAKTWQSPDAYSQQLIADLKHTWTIVRSAKTNKPVIIKHVCDKLKYLPGYSPQAKPKEFHLLIK